MKTEKDDRKVEKSYLIENWLTLNKTPFSRFWKSSRHIPRIADTEAPAICLFPAFHCLPFFPFLLYRLLL